MRSLLGVLATDQAGLASSAAAGADAIVIDLEDGVAATEKSAARAVTALFLRSHDDDTTVYVRINGRDSHHFEADIAALVGRGLAGVQLPKAESAQDIDELDRLLGAAEAAAGVALGSTRVVPTLESARAIQNAYAIASASSRIVGLMPAIGENGDLQQDLGYRSTSDEKASLYARSRIVLATRAAGAGTPIDGVWMAVGDDDGFLRSARLARMLGYRAKKVANASQVAAVNQIFAE
jgi:citrate lyase subunit beta/citryl-CoA lyase